jgi:hypothetical protein
MAGLTQSTQEASGTQRILMEAASDLGTALTALDQVDADVAALWDAQETRRFWRVAQTWRLHSETSRGVGPPVRLRITRLNRPAVIAGFEANEVASSQVKARRTLGSRSIAPSHSGWFACGKPVVQLLWRTRISPFGSLRPCGALPLARQS